MGADIIPFPNGTRFGAAIDDRTLYKLEEVAASKAVGQQRRLMLVVTARDQDTLAKLAHEEPAAWDEMSDAVLGYTGHLKGLLAMAESACARIAVIEQEACHG